MKTSSRIHQSKNYREFYEAVGERYPEEQLVYKSLRGLLRRKFVLGFIQESRGWFLDLGCNCGYYLSSYHNGQAVGVDIALSVLQIAHERNPTAYILQGDAQNLGIFRSDSFDSILCSEVIEHVPDPQQVLYECHRILKRGGKILLTTPNYKQNKPTWIQVGILSKYGVKGVEDDRYFHTAFRPEELKNMAEKAQMVVASWGTFEKEVKYATRIPVLFYHLINLLNQVVFKSESLADVNNRFLEISSLMIYKLCCTLRINQLLTRLVKEGVRTFVIAEKV
ncbi:MAG: class I SAM-dependent methyltransferase [bacterium]